LYACGETRGGTLVLVLYGTKSPIQDNTRIIGFTLKVPHGPWDSSKKKIKKRHQNMMLHGNGSAAEIRMVMPYLTVPRAAGNF
jgi:hypothetical protein